MNPLFSALLFALGLLAGMLLMLEVGRRIGQRQLIKDPEGARDGTGTVEGAVFGLLGLIIAFTFSGAASRFDERRALIVEEINAIGTAYLRLDLLPSRLQPPLRQSFRDYVDARLAAYRKIPDVIAAEVELTRATELQREIWQRAIAAAESEEALSDAMKLLLPALNAMIDITTTRTMATEIHPPAIIFAMLFLLSLASALLAGYGMARGKMRRWLHTGTFAVVMSISVYVIIDMEFPRLGLIRIDAFDQSLVDLRQSMR